jgi:hypothetical protein
MFISFTCLFLTSMILTCVVYYRWTRVLSLLEKKHPALYRRIAYPAPIRGGLWSIFRLSELLDETVSSEDRLFVRRTQNMVVASTLPALAMLVIAVLGAVR